MPGLMISEMTRIIANIRLYVIVADLDSGGVDTFGDKAKLKYTGLVQTLFGDGDRIRNSDASLEGQMMLRT
jgi:hypothetical protein